MDDCLSLLADGRRRQLLRYFRADPARVYTTDELLDGLEEWVPADEETIDRDSLAVQLHHNHLPALAEHGVIEYGDGIVRYRSSEDVETMLDALPSEDSFPSQRA